jgi:transcriptional regulator with XRE-family HTH domain
MESDASSSENNQDQRECYADQESSYRPGNEQPILAPLAPTRIADSAFNSRAVNPPMSTHRSTPSTDVGQRGRLRHTGQGPTKRLRPPPPPVGWATSASRGAARCGRPRGVPLLGTLDAQFPPREGKGRNHKETLAMNSTAPDSPLRLPPHLLERPEFLIAGADRDFGTLFRLVKKYGGISQVRIAAALDMTTSRVGEIIRGERQITSIDVIERVSDRLRIPGRLLGLASRPWEHLASTGPGSETQRNETADGLADLAAVLGYEDREITADVALRIAHTWLVIEPPQLTEMNAGRRIGSGLVHQIEARVAHLRRLDDYIGGGDSHAIVIRELNATAAAVRHGSYPQAIGARLLTAVADLCQLAGWVLDDARRHKEAPRYYIAGAHAAQAAGNTQLAANLLSTLSYQIANVGAPHDAVILARSALRGAEGKTTPLASALLWDRAAWAYARNRDLQACDRALGVAYEEYGDSGDDKEPAWVYWLDRRELDIMAGRCFTELGQPSRAEPLLTAAIASYDQTRAREVALYRSWLAESHVKAREIEQACAEANQALTFVDGVNSARAKERMAVIRQSLRPFTDVPAVRDLEERYRLLYGPAA